MDYKEKYDKAIEALRSLFAEQAIKHCDRVNIKDITNIFSELKESDDERIRENIIATIHLYYGEPLEDEAKEMVAWVEKQGEQKPVYNGKHKLLTVERAKEMSTFMRSGFEHNPAETEKGAKGNDREIPNSIWSEKDEAVLDALIRRFKGEDIYVSPNSAVEFLESIKDRVGNFDDGYKVGFSAAKHTKKEG